MEFTASLLLGIVLIAAGALLGLTVGSISLLSWFREWKAKAKAPIPAAARSADSGPPPGAIEWVADIVAAMSMAPDGTVLDALTDGDSRDEARARWIVELEASYVK